MPKCAGPNESFGLEKTCQFETHRRSFLADGKFTVALDETDFGHSAGEVELLAEDEKKAHADIDVFLARYAWLFDCSTPKGKLTQSRSGLGDSPEQSDFDHSYIPPRISNPSSSQYTSFNAAATPISRILLQQVRPGHNIVALWDKTFLVLVPVVKKTPLIIVDERTPRIAKSMTQKGKSIESSSRQDLISQPRFTSSAVPKLLEP
ncbi:hypothetical protein N7G274_010806 [Stereocaulon virgatum]|uniref:Uncharacterized protein n=1 Tax=Stereocaulon virgatum TaxID=373712 RepID=A0ABR3ZV36_9LECA